MDTGGAEKYHDFTNHKFADGSAVVFVYAINNLQSWTQYLLVDSTGKDLDSLQKGYSSFVIGNKTDLTSERVVYRSDLDSLVEHKDKQGHKPIQEGFETSAKDDPDGIKKVFLDIAEYVTWIVCLQVLLVTSTPWPGTSCAGPRLVHAMTVGYYEG